MQEEINVRVEDNPSKAERTLRPIMYVSWLLGVGVARPKNCPKWITMLLRVIHFGVCSVIVAFSAMDFANFSKEFTSKLFEIMYCMNETVCHLAAYYFVYHIIRHYDKWDELMKMMESLDQNIRKELSINDGCVKIRQMLAILLVLLCGPISLTAHILYYYFIAPDQIFASDLLLYYTIAQILLNSFVFDIVIYMICHRFRAINETIRQLNGKLETYWIALKIRRIRGLHNGMYAKILANFLEHKSGVRDVNETELRSMIYFFFVIHSVLLYDVTYNFVCFILKIDRLLTEMCSIIMVVNEIYGMDLLLCSTNAFIMVVAKLFRIYMSAAEKKNGFIFLNNVIWMIYGGQFIVMCWVCTLTHREINKIGLYINEFLLNTQHSTKFSKLNSFRNFRNVRQEQLEICNNECTNNGIPYLNTFGIESLVRSNFERDCIRNEINDFSLQLQHRIAFTACDFFEMDNSLLTRFISVITTYLIILVQFYKPENF